MIEQLTSLRRPELIIGIAGPVGVQIGWVESALEDSLRSVSYETRLIKLTAEMTSFSANITGLSGKDYFSEVEYKMNYATALCRERNDPAFLAKLAIRAIQRERQEITKDPKKVAVATAYVVRQLKRPQEVSLLRQVYGSQFILVSAHGSINSRTSRIIEQIKRHLSAEKTSSSLQKKPRAKSRNLQEISLSGMLMRLQTCTANTSGTRFTWRMCLLMDWTKLMLQR